MTARRMLVAVLALASLTVGMYAQGGGRGAQGADAQGGGRGGRTGGAGRQAGPPQPGHLMTGAWGEQALTPDSRGWGWMVKTYVEKAQRPLWNQAKEKLLNDGKVTSVTISTFQPETYCEARKHWDYVWFEMQHATLTFAEVQKMIAACPGVKGAAPMIRMPDALEANGRKARDVGVMGIEGPTVVAAQAMRDAAPLSRFLPCGDESQGGKTAVQFWSVAPGGYRQTIKDEFLLVVVVETVGSIINVGDNAKTFGL